MIVLCDLLYGLIWSESYWAVRYGPSQLWSALRQYLHWFRVSHHNHLDHQSWLNGDGEISPSILQKTNRAFWFCADFLIIPIKQHKTNEPYRPTKLKFCNRFSWVDRQHITYIIYISTITDICNVIVPCGLKPPSSIVGKNSWISCFLWRWFNKEGRDETRPNGCGRRACRVDRPPTLSTCPCFLQYVCSGKWSINQKAGWSKPVSPSIIRRYMAARYG